VIDTVTGWSGLVGLARDLALALAVGLLVIVAAVIVATRPGLDELQPTGVTIGGIIAGLGAAAVTAVVRVRARIPREVSRVFDVSEDLARRVGDDLASGRLRLSTTEAARGLVLVAAIPALVRASRRRFPLIGTLVAPVLGEILSRILGRLWPGGTREIEPPGGDGSPKRQVMAVLSSVRQRILPRLATGVRWVTLPLLLAGGTVLLVGVSVVFLTLVS